MTKAATLQTYVLAFLASAAWSSALQARPDACNAFDGAIIVTQTGDFLGSLTNSFDQKSIFNKFGRYGNQFNGDSIWNEFGSNGNPFSPNGAFNKFSKKPPLIVKDGDVIGYFSKNASLKGAVDPILLAVICFEYEPGK